MLSCISIQNAFEGEFDCGLGDAAEVKKTFFSAAQEEAASSTSTRSEKGGSASGPRPGHALDTGVTLLLGGGRPADTMRTASLAVAMALLQVGLALLAAA